MKETAGGHRGTSNALPKTSIMLSAVAENDASFDGIFLVAVKTTGIFCRPSCRAKTPLQKNVEFFATIDEATAAGYRPCKRCKPEQVSDRRPEWAKRLLRAVEADPQGNFSDVDLRTMDISPGRARSYFKQEFGMTFHEFLLSLRMGIAHAKLRSQADLDEVALESGYLSHSGFRDGYRRIIGCAPGSSRERDCLVTSLIETPLGKMRLAATSEGLCLAEFAGGSRVDEETARLRKYFACEIVAGSNAHLAQAERELAEYFAGARAEFDVKLVTPGSDFEQRVWKELQAIPYGRTISYLDLARRIGNPKAVRAVGTANGRNRIPIIIPCHRVVNHNGQLGGYGGGLWRKRRLLELEHATLPVAAQRQKALW